jgi:hypothetical protein
VNAYLHKRQPHDPNTSQSVIECEGKQGVQEM